MNVIKKLKSMPFKLVAAFKFLCSVYRFGGYTTHTLTSINREASLKGKHVLVTGGGSGIGLAIAQKCLSEGAKVVITGRNETKLLNTISREGSPALKSLVWDVSKTELIEEMLIKTETLLEGEVDVLVNNAGIVKVTEFPNVKESLWDQVYDTNSKGVFFLTQALCSRWMNKEKDRGLKKVINISSQGGYVGATHPYRMSKWDIVGLTQGLGLRLASEGIIINGIAPGMTATDALPFVLKQGGNSYTPDIPIGRYIQPSEIAELASFLMSDASNSIVGQTIKCDGGYCLI